MQLGFAIQMQGGTAREKEAQGIYNTVLRQKPSDIGLVTVALRNRPSFFFQCFLFFL